MEYIYDDVVVKEEECIHISYTYYLFYIYVNNVEVGRLTFRIGNDEEFFYDGHIGYEIEEGYRGNHYAYKACKALIPFLKMHRNHVLITCDPNNIASKKTIERLGVTYKGRYPIPSKLKNSFNKDELEKEVYCWDLGGNYE